MQRNNSQMTGFRNIFALDKASTGYVFRKWVNLKKNIFKIMI